MSTTYPYGMYNAPTVGNGLGGLPRRSNGVGYFSRFGPIKARWILPFTEVSTSLAFNFSQISDLRHTSVRVVTKAPSDSSSNTIAGSGDEVFPFMVANPTLNTVEVSISHTNTAGTNTYAQFRPSTNIVFLALTASTQNDGYVIITEYAFSYRYLGSGSYYAGATSFTALTLRQNINSIQSVCVSHFSSLGGSSSNSSIAQGTFQPSGYYASTETILDVPFINGESVSYSCGGYFSNPSTYRYQTTAFSPNDSIFNIFEITGY